MQRRNLQVAVLETTNRCNLNCLICGSDSKDNKNPQELSSAEWCRIMEEMRDVGLKTVFFSGGEPTLKPGIEDMIEYAAELGLRWGMVSNGLFIPEHQLNLFKRKKPVAIGLSVDGEEAMHNRLRGNPRSFQMLQKYIGEFRERRIPFSIITTIHKLNWRQLFSIAAFVQQNKIYGWQIQLAMPFGRMNQNRELLLTQEEFGQVCLMIERIRRILPEVRIAAADCFAWAPAGSVREGRWEGCSAGIDSVGIDALGNVRGCLSMTGCKPEGNLKERNFADIWNDENLFSYNRCFDSKNASDFCRACPKIMRCRGGCNSQSYSMTGKFQQGVYCYYKINSKGGGNGQRSSFQIRVPGTPQAERR